MGTLLGRKPDLAVRTVESNSVTNSFRSIEVPPWDAADGERRPPRRARAIADVRARTRPRRGAFRALARRATILALEVKRGRSVAGPSGGALQALRDAVLGLPVNCDRSRVYCGKGCQGEARRLLHRVSVAKYASDPEVKDERRKQARARRPRGAGACLIQVASRGRREQLHSSLDGRDQPGRAPDRSGRRDRDALPTSRARIVWPNGARCPTPPDGARAAASARERRPLAAPTNRKATAASTRGDARETATIVDAAGASS